LDQVDLSFRAVMSLILNWHFFFNASTKQQFSQTLAHNQKCVPVMLDSH